MEWALGEEAEDGGLLVKAGQGIRSGGGKGDGGLGVGDGGLMGGEFVPLRDGEGADVLGWAGEVGSDAEAGRGAAGGEDGGEQLIVTIGGFDEYFCTVVAL